MDVSTLAVLLLAVGFAYTNGFHDTANAIAISVSTRALTPRLALVLAAVANVAGAFFGARIADTVWQGIVDPDSSGNVLALCGAALIGAIIWNVLTWWRGLPASSTHALVGGLIGAALVDGAVVRSDGVIERVFVPLLISPLAGFALAWVAMAALACLCRGRERRQTSRLFRYLQTGSAAAVACGHGMQDAGKTAGVMVLVLSASGVSASPNPPAGAGSAASTLAFSRDAGVPLWVILICALALGLGTFAGGWPIMRTMGRGIIDFEPSQGFAAEASAAAILFVGTALRLPISTTHVTVAAITGVGTSRSVRSVRWGRTSAIVAAWVLTLPVAALLAAACYPLLAALF